MNLLKKFTVGVSTAALVLACATPVFGAAETSNTGIDDHSFVSSTALDMDTMTAIGGSSGTTLTNLDVALASSGLNFQIGGEDTNTIESMSAGALWETNNFANVNETEFAESGGAKATNSNVSDHSGDIAGGAPGGPVSAYANDSDNFTVSNSNVATTLNNLTASIANTGLNFQIDNEDGNSTKTGAGLSGAYAANVVNSNKTEIGSTSGGAEAGNTAITDHSFSAATALDNDTVGAFNVNTITTVTNVTASIANTGLNFQIGNEDTNSIETGAASSVSMTENFVNVSETSVAVGGGAKATNGTVNDHSSATSVATDNDIVTVSNTNTVTTVTSLSTSIANSGGNAQIGNEDGNSIKSGGVTAVGSTSNVVNGNQVTVH